ncbi:hypothetical protein H4R99_006990, partial [Coemansia sp. RSA 1722]
MCSNAIPVLHLVQAMRITLLPGHTLQRSSTAIVVAVHMYLLWSFLSPATREIIDFFWKDVCAYKGFLIARIARQRKLVSDDFRDPQFEAQFNEEVDQVQFEPSR